MRILILLAGLLPALALLPAQALEVQGEGRKIEDTTPTSCPTMIPAPPS